ncbi:hypothetical protein [Chamaesiphon minutus]|uniref:Immunity protein 30 domain-containing protein n=1 Tax=Chamaesiphon minutus (strain ATCC 27169 / PCC 6605) TaxID=1173020 RepID=K9UAK4_CHAP6|nr:hypothetical protein [Chamaesiphon minutus]AFY91658.1 hypothetical protein Cha6605_0359 [Chamaesiphon minutus PCC 6605]
MNTHKSDNLLKSKINELITRIEKLHVNDPDTIHYYSKIKDLLLDNERETISLLQTCDNKNMISHVVAFFENVADKFPSKELLHIFESLAKKYSSDKILIYNLNIAIDELRYCLKNGSVSDMLFKE